MTTISYGDLSDITDAGKNVFKNVSANNCFRCYNTNVLLNGFAYDGGGCCEEYIIFYKVRIIWKLIENLC